MGNLLTTILRRVVGSRPNKDLRTVARQVDDLATEHQKNLRKDPQDVANSFFSKRLKEAKDVRAEIIFIKGVRSKFKAKRQVASEKLAVAEKELKGTNDTISGAELSIRMLGYDEVHLTEYEDLCESIERRIDMLLQLREQKYKEINRLITSGKKKSQEWSNLRQDVENINKELKAARYKLKMKVHEKSYYQGSVAEIQQQRKGSLDLLEEAQGKKLLLERNISSLRISIARHTLYIQGTYDYVRRLYLMESEESSTPAKSIKNPV